MTARSDFSFVPALGMRHLRDDELTRARREATPGSHAHAILREAMLVGDVDIAQLSQRVQSLGDDYVFHCFSSPAFENANLVLRSEYLILREVGDGRLDASKTSAIAARTAERLLATSPRRILYRLCDYDPADFEFLAHRNSDASGAARLLDDPRLLALDLATLEALAPHVEQLDVLVPYVRFADEFNRLAQTVRTHFAQHDAAPARVGMMLEVPANLFQGEQLDAADFFAFGPADLISGFYGGLDRNTPDFARADTNVLIDPVRHVLATLSSRRERDIYISKSLLELGAHLDLDAPTIRRLYFPDQL